MDYSPWILSTRCVGNTLNSELLLVFFVCGPLIIAFFIYLFVSVCIFSRLISKDETIFEPVWFLLIYWNDNLVVPSVDNFQETRCSTATTPCLVRLLNNVPNFLLCVIIFFLKISNYNGKQHFQNHLPTFFLKYKSKYKKASTSMHTNILTTSFDEYLNGKL